MKKFFKTGAFVAMLVFASLWLASCGNTAGGSSAGGNLFGLGTVRIPFSGETVLTSDIVEKHIKKYKAAVVIEKGYTAIGEEAFKNYTLKSVVIPDSVTSIGAGAFSRCEFLESVTNGSGVTSIREMAFYQCESLESIVIPDSVTSIEEHAFGSCTSLEKVTVLSETPPGIWDDCFLETAPGMKIYVPKESVDKYKNAQWWKNYSIEAIPEE